MKINNIAFSGFMAAIMSVGAAAAADGTAKKIASQAYVDKLVGAKANTVANVGANAGNIATVDANGQYQVSTTSIDDLATNAALTTTNNAVTGLTTRVGTTETNVTALQEAVTGKEDSSNKATEITDANKASGTLYPSVGAIVKFTEDKVAQIVAGDMGDALAAKADKVSGMTAENTDGIATVNAAGQYVATTTKISDLATATALGAVSTQVDTNKTDISSLKTSVAGKEDVSNKTKVISAESTDDQYPTAKAVNDMFDLALGDIDGKEDKSNKVTTISSTSTDVQYPSAKAVNTLVDDSVSTLTDLMTEADTALGTRIDGVVTSVAAKADKVSGVTAETAGGIATVNATGQYEMSTTKISDLATKNDITTELNGVEKTANRVDEIAAADKDSTTKYTSVKAVTAYAVPKPGENCTAESGRCVLSVDTNGNPYWMDVTDPLE